jgi:hypothetical protein
MIEKEGNYEFDFGQYECERPDKEHINGLLEVDFVVETSTHLLFIEIKDFDALKSKNTPAAQKHLKVQQESDLNKLKVKKDGSNKDIVKLFRTEIGEKFKYSTLRKYVEGYKFEKPVKYIFILEFSLYGEQELMNLRGDIFNGYIPTFKEIKKEQRTLKIENFEIMNIKKFSETYFRVTKIN